MFLLRGYLGYNDYMRKREKVNNIAFFGDANVEEDSTIYQEAFETAKFLAEKGYTIVNGGGPGVMKASTEGAESVDGDTIAVTFYPENAPGFEGRYVGNEADREVETENYVERMFTLMENGDLFIIFKGGTGTISELGTAWVLAKLYYGHHKPFILFGSFWREVIDAIVKNLNIDEQETDVFEIVETKEEVVERIEELETKVVNFE